MKFYTVHEGQSLNDMDHVLGHYRKFEDAKRAFDDGVERMQSNIELCWDGFEVEHPRENDVIFWYVVDGERADDWESVWITEEELQ